MTIKQALKKYHKIEIELLLAHVLRKNKEFLFMNPEKKLSSYQVTKLSSLAKRRTAGEPIAYIFGYKDFYGLRFKVNRDVLIPRPETEWVVEKISNFKFQISKNPIKILDIGTGSGNIIISLKKGLGLRAKGVEFYASDVSKKALNIAKSNAEKHSVKIKFIHSDLLASIKINPDIIVANLPYLDFRWKSSGLKFEPKQALFAEKNGLMIIERLLKQIANRENKPLLIYLEFDPRQKPDVNRLIKKYLPKSEIKFYRDFAGHWRFAEILSAK